MTGEQVQVLHRYARGTIEQYFENPTGTRRNVFRILPNDRLRFEVTITSPQLPRRMRYALIYRRTS